MAERRAPGGKSKDKGEGPIAIRIHQPLGQRRAGHRDGSDLGWLVSLPRFCHQLAALRRPETDDSVMYFRSITPITSDRIPSSQSSTHNENTTLSRPPIYLLNGPPSSGPIALPDVPRSPVPTLQYIPPSFPYALPPLATVYS